MGTRSGSAERAAGARAGSAAGPGRGGRRERAPRERRGRGQERRALCVPPRLRRRGRARGSLGSAVRGWGSRPGPSRPSGAAGLSGKYRVSVSNEQGGMKVTASAGTRRGEEEEGNCVSFKTAYKEKLNGLVQSP
ncbi:CDGSH iron-sulfur domain-containing protein 1 isoform X2 [Prinia subflava]|uniref:CDGSH iron-sulfur domain-containing protein 1 isoform X2 n=1 Tax=Prinia subflava TaxID=208062 RepID=UPI002FE06223